MRDLRDMEDDEEIQDDDDDNGATQLVSQTGYVDSGSGGGGDLSNQSPNDS